MAALLSLPSMQVAFSFLRKVICEPMQPHGDAAQLAAHACRKVRSELWQRNLFRRTKRGVQNNNKRRTCEKMLQQNASNKCFKKLLPKNRQP
jgi:hypothetical protein